MTDQLLGILKFALLALLYLFFARVLWAVWSEVRGPKPLKPGAQQPVMARAAGGQSSGPRGTVSPTDPTVHSEMPIPATTRPPRAVKGRRGAVGRLVIVQPKARKGSAYAVGPEITMGRATTCTVAMPDDTFVSQLHARVFVRDAGVWAEDLGSTNGTFLNGRKLVTPEQLAKGDRLQIGNTVFEAE